MSTTMAMTRRSALLGSSAGLLGFPAILRAQDKTIVTTLFGGIYEQRYRKHVLEPFERKRGVKFVIKYGSPNEWLTSAMVNRDDPEIDLPFLSLPVAMKAIKTNGIFLDLTPAMIPHLRDVEPAFYDVYERKAVGFNYVDNGLVYRHDLVKEPPTSWKELWDPRFKNQLILPDISGGFFHETVVIAALLHGGSETNLEPGYEALKRLKPNIVRWYKSPNEVSGILQRGEAAMAGSGSARAYAMKDGGMPVNFTVPKEGAPVGVLSYHVPIKARNRELLLAFIDFALALEQQTGFGNEMQSGMVNRSFKPDPAIADRIVPHAKLWRLNWPVIEPKMTEIAERMQRDVIGR
jgi:putative spermidine/putrescine transport system substrate-binding protein